MDERQLYTALSITKTCEHIHINNREFNRMYFNGNMPILESAKAKFNTLNQNEKIYKVT